MKEPKRINLANLPTPVQKIKFNNATFNIKRDDFTGVELSGNKVRKLEYILHEAKREKVDYVITCGAEQSNHCRAAVIAAKQLGIKTILYLWGNDKANPDGNLFLDKLYDAELRFVSKQDFMNIGEKMENASAYLLARGENSYIVPPGGTSPLGIWGYINFVNELAQQTDLKKTKGILTACGSGGTTAGLLLGAHLHNWNTKVFAVDVLFMGDNVKERILSIAEETIRKYDLGIKLDEKKLEVMSGYSNEGYKKIDPEKLDIIKEFASQTGIILDPAYTGKAFYAYNENFLHGKKSSNTMFLHTGGIYGVFAKRKLYL